MSLNSRSREISASKDIWEFLLYYRYSLLALFFTPYSKLFEYPVKTYIQIITNLVYI